MFTGALLTTAKTQEQPKCSPTDDWLKEMPRIYTMDYYSGIKKNEILPFAATWMNREIITLSEVRQRRTNHILCICGI